MGRFTQSRRCWRCDINWPHLGGYVECPNCGEETEPSELRSLSTQDAHAEKKRHQERKKRMEEFEEFYNGYSHQRIEGEVAAFRAELDKLPTVEHPLGRFEASGERPSRTFLRELEKEQGEQKARDWIASLGEKPVPPHPEDEDWGMGC